MALSLTFLGTSAFDFSPELDGEYARAFDKNARRASCVLLGETALVDCGVHCMQSLRILSADVSRICDIFITHLHADHFDPRNIERIAEQCATPPRLWVRDDAVLPPLHNVKIERLEPFRTYDAGEFSVTGLAANHDPRTYPQHLLLRKDGKSLLYACDGGWMRTETFDCLRGAKLDMLVLDATMGFGEGDIRIAEHNSLSMIALLLPSLKAAEIVDGHTKIYLSHLAPSLHLPHDETARAVAPLGLLVACDGLTVSL